MVLMVLPFKGGNISKETRVSFACAMWSVTFILVVKYLQTYLTKHKAQTDVKHYGPMVL